VGLKSRIVGRTVHPGAARELAGFLCTQTHRPVLAQQDGACHYVVVKDDEWDGPEAVQMAALAAAWLAGAEFGGLNAPAVWRHGGKVPGPGDTAPGLLTPGQVSSRWNELASRPALNTSQMCNVSNESREPTEGETYG
jgi:transcription elongation factor